MIKKLFVFSLLLLNKVSLVAQYILGVYYLNGVGIAKDDKEAVRIFTLAAQQGHSAAQNNLGWCYQNGVGVVRDDKEAVRLYTLAAQQGDSRCTVQSGMVLSKWCWGCER